MTLSATPQNRYIDRPAPSSLADVIEVILDKGLVIDAYVRVSLLGIELVTVDARIVVASVDTYLRFADAVNRLDMQETQVSGIPELMEGMSQAGTKGKTAGVIEGIREKVSEMLPGSDDKDDGARGARGSGRSASKKTATRARPTAQRHTSSGRA